MSDPPTSLARIGFLRVCNEENTIIACLLSIAPILDHILILWANMDDRSIDLAREWQPVLEKRFGCSIRFLHYPHPVLAPHSVADMRTIPAEFRMDTYTNYGLDAIRSDWKGIDYSVGKLDTDQIYVTSELDHAFSLVRTPADCVALRGHNTLVHKGALMLYTPCPVNGTGRDCLICGSGNLPRFGIKAPYEYDQRPHPRIADYPAHCWLHFMRNARYGNVIRPFRDDEIAPICRFPDLEEKYSRHILPLLREAGSPYAELSTVSTRGES